MELLHRADADATDEATTATTAITATKAKPLTKTRYEAHYADDGKRVVWQRIDEPITVTPKLATPADDEATPADDEATPAKAPIVTLSTHCLRGERRRIANAKKRSAKKTARAALLRLVSSARKATSTFNRKWRRLTQAIAVRQAAKMAAFYAAQRRCSQCGLPYLSMRHAPPEQINAPPEQINDVASVLLRCQCAAPKSKRSDEASEGI